jgi:circadian clock protein KaiB
MSPRPKFRFQLFVAGDAGNSAQAAANLSAFCRTYLPDRHTIEIVDVLREPKRALAESIFLTPTLVALTPPPVRRIVGTLSQTQTMLLTLGLEALAP